MAEMPDEPHRPRRQVPAWFERLARLSWGFIGMIGAVGLVLFGLSALRELVIPLVLAAMFAVVCGPGVDWLERRRVPRSVGAVLLVLVIMVVVTFNDVVQLPLIGGLFGS